MCLFIPWDNPKSKPMFSSSLVLWVRIKAFNFDSWVHGLAIQNFEFLLLGLKLIQWIQ
jgi:hypothetical protein